MSSVESIFGQDDLARRLKETREYLGLSQQHVSSATGIARSAISEIERGNRKVDSLELAKLARLYQYPASYFLGEEPPQAESVSALGRILGADLTSEDYEEVRKFAEYLTYSRRARRS
ncbi:helix-turn-helix domain-containing protein [Nocardia brasiliensis]|uniref:helix-turn-helix domain-containing protein n=1 Tax=Nocardia brasiliensis TaxID=37326 RepID=UPI001893DD2B|nr:helix-turn-helix transcriptional regulator [Nocardia brasiliensis]MBF6127836.1 helix-turn-helix transcriptional regulator [Nocardia brasiliensis]